MANNKVSAPFRELMDGIIRQEQQRTGKKMSYAEAYSLFRKDALPSKVNPHGSMENPRNFEIPTNLLETNPVKLLAIYDSRLGRRVETARVWGNDNQFITKAISNIKRTTDKEFKDSLPYVYQDFIREMVGSVGSSGGKFDMLGLAESASKLGFSQANRFNARLAAATAKIAIDDYIKMYKKNPDGVKGRYAIEKLKSFFSLDVN